jgi:hypothetical protein
MIASVTRLAVLLQTLFLDDARHLASETGFARRQRQLTGPVFARALVFSWLDQPDATLEVLAANAAELGADVCPQAIDNRLTPRAVAFFEALLCAGLDYAFQLDAAPPPLLGRFEGVYAFDTTHVSLPAALAFELPGHGGSAPPDGAAACAVQVVLELSQGGVVEVQLGPGRTNDLSFELAHAALPAGALRLADRGFYDLGLFAAYTEAGVYWISRPQPLTQVSDDPQPGPAGRLWVYLRGCQVDRWVWLGKVRLPARLIAVRVAPEEAERRRRKLRRRRRRKGEGPPSAAQEGLCEWDVSVTNVPREKASVEEVIGLRRLRWQVELLFKLFKSIGGWTSPPAGGGSGCWWSCTRSCWASWCAAGRCCGCAAACWSGVTGAPAGCCKGGGGRWARRPMPCGWCCCCWAGSGGSGAAANARARGGQRRSSSPSTRTTHATSTLLASPKVDAYGAEPGNEGRRRRIISAVATTYEEACDACPDERAGGL